MFWREKERTASRDLNGGPPSGQVRVLLVGDSASWRKVRAMSMKIDRQRVGKTSLVHLITEGSATANPTQTIGCSVSIKHMACGGARGSSNSIKDDTDGDFFVELWDVCGHERYKDCRPIFYKQINGVIFVHDLTQRKTKSNLQKWAAEISVSGTFSAPLGSYGSSGLPIPYLVIGNKADIADKQGSSGSSGNLVDAARQWVEKQGLLSSSESLPLTGCFPGSSGLIAAAKEARFDKESISKFFRMLIKRRYFSNEQPLQNLWSITPTPNSIYHAGEISSDDDKYNKNFSTHTEVFQSNTLPLPAQRNLVPPSTLYPQQPVSISDSFNHQRASVSGSSSTKSRRADINV